MIETETRYPKVVYAVLSAATGLWLVLQVAVAVIGTDHAYPITAYAMFSQPSDGTHLAFVLAGEDVDGEIVRIEPDDVGLTPLQLRGYLVRNIGPEAAHTRPGASASLGELADIIEGRQGVTLDELTLWREEYHLDDAPASREEVATWRR